MPKRKNHKKLVLQHSYLSMEKEDVQDTCMSSEKEIRDFMEERFPDLYSSIVPSAEKVKDLPKEDLTEHQPLSDNSIEADDTDAASASKNKDLRKLYRKIVEKTHPDKTGNAANAHMFSEAAAAYKDQNIAKLLEMAGILNIEVPELLPETHDLLEKNVESLTKDISSMKGSVAWNWAHATTNKEKEDLVMMIFRSKGITPP